LNPFYRYWKDFAIHNYCYIDLTFYDLLGRSGFPTMRCNTTLIKDRIIEAKNAVEKLSITKPESIKDCVMFKVIALITRMYNTRVSTVIGMVRIIIIGLTMIFSIDKIIATINAILKPAILKPLNNSPTSNKAIEIKNTDVN